MAKAFKRKGARFVARLDEEERRVVVGLLEQTHDFLAPVPREPTGDPFEDLVAGLGLPRLKDSETDAADEPRDPVMDRLIPSAHRDDPELAAEFRRLTEYGLREGKAANLATAIEALRHPDGDKITLDSDRAHAMMVALTDVRLVLGERLGLRTDEDSEALQDRLEAASQDDPFLQLAACYDFLTWLQESLIHALMGK